MCLLSTSSLRSEVPVGPAIVALMSRSNSSAAKTLALANASSPIDPPIVLLKKEREIFDAIISSNKRDHWTKSRIALAANCAKSFTTLDKLRNGLRKSGVVVENREGMLVESPLVASVQKQENAIIRMFRAMGLTANHLTGAGAKATTKNEASAHTLEDNLAERGIGHLIGSKQRQAH